MRPHLILAALDEALRHQDPDDRPFAQGTADARLTMRIIAEQCHQPGRRSVSDLEPIAAALRLACGPIEEYRPGSRARGFRQVQRQVRLILDGDYDVVTALLEQASRRSLSQYTEAIDAGPEDH